MAEVLGAVASGIAVAEVGLKVGTTVWKLKKLWEEVHEVPQTIGQLMRQIEMMDPILSDYENNLPIQNISPMRQIPNHNDAPAIQSAAYCREALEDLRCLAEDLEGAVMSEKRSRRTFARVRVVLRKNTINGFQDRLERATKLLQLSQMNYLTANAAITGAIVTNMWAAVADMKVQQQLVLQQLSDSISASLTVTSPFPVVNQHEQKAKGQTLVKGMGAQRQGNSVSLPWTGLSIFGAIIVKKSEADSDEDASYAARIQLPKWFSRRVWDISVKRARSGWQANLSAWNVVPDDSPGMVLARIGDLDGLIDLFDRRLASPRDCNTRGITIFHYACLHCRTNIVERFIDIKLDAINTGITIADIFIMSTLSLLANRSMEIMHPMASRGLFEPIASAAAYDYENPIDADTNNLVSSAYLLAQLAGRQEALKIYIRTCLPYWHDLSPNRKQRFLLSDANSSHWTPGTIRLVTCPNGPIEKSDVQQWREDDASLLCLVLGPYFNSFAEVQAEPGWHSLLLEVITATDDLHYMVNTPVPYELPVSYDLVPPVTAFGRVLQLHRYYIGEVVTKQKVLTQSKVDNSNLRLQSLISLLGSCGRDALDFGRKEAAIWVNDNKTAKIIGDVLHLGVDDRCGGYYGLPYLSAVHYGAEPVDWYFEMDFHYENHAGDFWNLIENPPQLVPGAWIDEA